MEEDERSSETVPPSFSSSPFSKPLMLPTKELKSSRTPTQSSGNAARLYMNTINSTQMLQFCFMREDHISENSKSFQEEQETKLYEPPVKFDLSEIFTTQPLSLPKVKHKAKIDELKVSQGTNSPTSGDLDLEAFNATESIRSILLHLKHEGTVPSNKLSLIGIITEEEWKISGDVIKGVSLSLENWIYLIGETKSTPFSDYIFKNYFFQIVQSFIKENDLDSSNLPSISSLPPALSHFVQVLLETSSVSSLSSQNFRTWIEELELFSIDSSGFIGVLLESQIADWYRNHYSDI